MGGGGGGAAALGGDGYAGMARASEAGGERVRGASNGGADAWRESRHTVVTASEARWQVERVGGEDTTFWRRMRNNPN